MITEPYCPVELAQESEAPNHKSWFWVSASLNLLLLMLVIYMARTGDLSVATVENSIGTQRTVLASELRREIASRHAEDVLGDLTGREMVKLAADESRIQLDVEELEARWHLWSQEPGVKARLDSGATSERDLRARLITLVLLDQLSLNELNQGEKESVLRRFFESNTRDLEELRLRHILLDSQKDAQDVAQRLAAGVDFSELARRFSLDPLTREQGGDMGWKRRDDFNEELGPILFFIPEGRASKPLPTRHGWHLFLVEEKRTEFEDLAASVRRRWCELRRADTMAELRERFKVTTPSRAELVESLRPRHDPEPPSSDERVRLE